jgi:CubicO group peptidase (beta-lactamase class C family)
MNSKKKGEKVPMEAKAYPGEFFFFVRVNELLHGLGSKLDVEMSYLDVLKPYAEQGLALSDYYSIKQSHPTFGFDNAEDSVLHERVRRVLAELRDKEMIAGAQVCVIDNEGKILTNNVEGHMGGLKRNNAMRPDALILGYSCTKAIAATLAHLMVEEGYLTYDEPICERVWPAFCPTESYPSELETALDSTPEQLAQQWGWKRRITLRHILTHSSGLWSALPARMTIKTMASCEECCSAFEYNPDFPDETILPTTEPGAKTEYHFMSFGWLVAGALCGAYSIRHGRKGSTFEEVYEAVLKPRLSESTLRFGFRPLGGTGDFPATDTETADINLSKLLQMQREAEAVGEGSEMEAHMSLAAREMRKSFKGKEFLLDARIWNCEEARVANVPSAGGRFSAMGLAHFYHDLGSDRIMREGCLKSATVVVTRESTANSLQGQTSMASNADEKDGISFGLGYQLIRFDGDTADSPAAFGHAGVGGSIGFHHKESGTSVGIMLNKADGDRNTAKRIVKTIADHYNW